MSRQSTLWVTSGNIVCSDLTESNMDNVHRNPFAVNYDHVRTYSGEAFCRLCFSQIYEMHRIFPTTGQPNRILMKKIEYCTEICVSFEKDSNASICVKCVALIEEFFRFKQLCSCNEYWLKQDRHHYHHVANAGGSGMSSSTGIGHHDHPQNPMQQTTATSPKSNDSLLTIDTERDVSSDDDIIFEENTFDETLVKMEDPLELSHSSGNEFSEVTSSGHCLRAKKPTTRLTPMAPSSPMTLIPIKSDETDSQYNESESSFETIEDVIDLEQPDNPDGYKLVRGAKSRSNRQYLVYKNYRYNNPSNDKKIWRCTHRGPIYCRAVVMLEKNRVIELNNHFHNHPPPRMPGKKKPTHPVTTSTKPKDNVKISLVLKKEKEPVRRPSRSCTKQPDTHKWFIKANRKTVDGYTYTFCGLRKDGIIRLKCITKGCACRIYMYSNGNLLRTNMGHSHQPHVPV